MAPNNELVDQHKHHTMTPLNPSTQTAGLQFTLTDGSGPRMPSCVALDLLRRTALHLASTPGGLRLTAGHRAWLQGLGADPETSGLSAIPSQTGKTA
jgi:hypothetical protein